MPVLSNLTEEQRDAVLRFLLFRMKQDTRRELMGALPLAYVGLFPESAAAVLDRVRHALNLPEES